MLFIWLGSFNAFGIESYIRGHNWRVVGALRSNGPTEKENGETLLPKHLVPTNKGTPEVNAPRTIRLVTTPPEALASVEDEYPEHSPRPASPLSPIAFRSFYSTGRARVQLRRK